MRKFIFKVTVFILILIIFFTGTIYLVKFHSIFKIDKNTHMIIVGHSQSECAYNDSLIDNLTNFSSSGESFFYTYYKAKKIIEQNPQINTIFIEFTNNQIDKVMDDWIWGDMYLSQNFVKYALFIDREGHKLLLEKNPSGFKRSIIPILKNNIKIIASGFDYKSKVGGYLHLNRNLEDSLYAEKSNSLDSPRQDEKLSKTTEELSVNNIEYLLKLIQYCNQIKIKIFLVRSPLHNKYKGFKNEKKFQKILSAKLSNIEFLDFSKFPLDNSEFADLEHLNYRGAVIFSNWFNNLIKEGLLEEQNKQTLIDKGILETPCENIPGL